MNHHSEKKNSAGGGVWLLGGLGAVAGVVFGPWAVKLAVIGVVVLVVAVLAAAVSMGTTVGRAAGFYAGRLGLAVFTAVAVLLVEWPLRGLHYAWCRLDLAVRGERLLVTCGYQLHDAARRLVAGTVAYLHGTGPRPALQAIDTPADRPADAAAGERERELEGVSSW